MHWKESDMTDIQFLKNKLSQATSPEERERLTKRIEMLEDSIVFYRLEHPPRAQG